MKPLFRTVTLAAMAAVMALCSVNVGVSFAADSEQKTTCIVHYDLSGEGLVIPDDENGNPQTIEDVETRPNSSIFVTKVVPEREGYSFSCWSVDDLMAYPGGSAFVVGEEDVTLHPVWVDNADRDFHRFIFRVEKDGVIDEEAEEKVPPINARKGKYINIPLYIFPPEGYTQNGWTDGVHEFLPGSRIIMGSEEIILRPNLKKIYKMIYTVGDADRILGAKTQIYEQPETYFTNLQDSDRFSRMGFEIAGWHCLADDKDYPVLSPFTMPSCDAIFEPIWEPIRYVVLFRPGTSSKDNVKVPGYTDTAIVAPECTVTKEGYTFGGWKYEDTIVQPGEEYVIKGAAPGLGIAFNAVWIEGSEPEQPAKAFEISIVDKETGAPVNDVRLSANATRVENGSTVVSEFPIDGKTENPKKVYYDSDKLDSVTVSDFSIIEAAYNGYAYKLDEKDIVTKIDNGVAYYTVKVSKKVYPDDVKPYSYVVKAVDKETGELVNDAKLIGSWSIEYKDAVTGPLAILDTSAANPFIISYAKYKDAEKCSFCITNVYVTNVYDESNYTLSTEDITAETDSENHITTYTVKLAKKATEIKPNSFVIKVLDAETGELVKDASLTGILRATKDVDGHEMTSSDLIMIDCSKNNPYVYDYSKFKNNGFKSVGVSDLKSENNVYTVKDVQIDDPTEDNIVNYTVLVSKSDIAYGDANCDGVVELADAILLMQSLANPDKYGTDGTAEKRLTAQGKLNGDVDLSVKGITTGDALAIQEYLLNKIDTLPVVPVDAD